MLLVDTYIDFVNGKGLGLFANEYISKGTIYWIRNEEFDKIISNDLIKSFEKLIVDFIKTYGVLEVTRNWYLSSDNSRFTNHSKSPNTKNHFNSDNILIYSSALKNINIGEEILCDYTEICLTCINGVHFDPVD